MRTRLSICKAKRRYGSREEAQAAAAQADVLLCAYRCDRDGGGHYHLTSRTKGKGVGIGIDKKFGAEDVS